MPQQSVRSIILAIWFSLIPFYSGWVNNIAHAAVLPWTALIFPDSDLTLPSRATLIPMTDLN